MEKAVWDDQYNLGVEAIDKAHANLFRIVGKLMVLVKDEVNSESACREGLKYLENYTMKHFFEEEAYMRSIRYKEYARHKKVHDKFRGETLKALKWNLETERFSPLSVQRFVGVLLGWLTGHIMTEDQAIVGKVALKRVYDRSGEIAVVARVVDQAMQDVFRLNAELVDENYNGRNVGKGFYCRLDYDMEDGSRIRLLLGVEEQLLLKGVGMLLGWSALKKDGVVDQAALQIFKQLFDHMGRLFRVDVPHELRREDMLTQGQFREEFMTRYPCNLLFRTRVGHFIFCFRKWKAKR
ncbi:MAG: hemerythrin family protein [Hungatella sp.]|nr:hemerythrin family protein [Hungatella sp.]